MPALDLLRWRNSPDDSIDDLNHSCLCCPGRRPGLRFLLWSVCHGEDPCPLAIHSSTADSYQVSQSVNLLYGRSTSQGSFEFLWRTWVLPRRLQQCKRQCSNFCHARSPSLRMLSAHFIENFLRRLWLRWSCWIRGLRLIWDSCVLVVRNRGSCCCGSDRAAGRGQDEPNGGVTTASADNDKVITRAVEKGGQGGGDIPRTILSVHPLIVT